MKNKMMKKMNRKMRKAKMKGNVIMEMAEDLIDLVANAKLYKKLKRKNRKTSNFLLIYKIKVYKFIKVQYSILGIWREVIDKMKRL